MNECVYCLPQMSMMEDPTENAEEESEDELNLKRYILYTCITIQLVLICHQMSHVFFPIISRLKYLLNVSDKLESNILMLLHWAKVNCNNSL